MHWLQRILELPAAPRGFHLITPRVTQAVPELAEYRHGLMHVFILHTSASLTLNENADPDVPLDLETGFNHAAPESLPYRHTIEGPDDMPAHIKSSMIGSSVTVPITNGHLLLGAWQGIYLCEHRNAASRRKLAITVWGERNR